MPESGIMIIFPTTHMTLSAEKSLEDEGVKHRTVLKPRLISSDCGLAIQINEGSMERCQRRFIKDGLFPVRFFRETGGQWECVEELDS